MRIRRLKLTGFKSFVEPAELRIEPGLTGVVGPNGCGKSNVLEAIRWAMGEGSPKSLRGAGMDDVIFAGTASRPARDFAEVSLLLDGADGETEVTRRIERGAGSAYRINGRDVRAKDVALLFADAATGAHSPALVSQGRIGAIIAARPAERRAMLEEAAGIAGLHVRRKDAEGKLRAAEANLVRLDELLADMEGRAAALRRQAKAAERYRRLSDAIGTAEARLVFTRWREAAAAASAAKAEADRAALAVEAAHARHRAATACQEERAVALAGCRTAARQAREAAVSLGHRLAGVRAEQEAAVRRLAELATRTEALASDQVREAGLVADAESAVTRLRDEQAAIANRLARSEAAHATVEARRAEREDQALAAEAALGDARALQAAELAEARIVAAAHQAAAARATRAEAEAGRLRAALADMAGEAPLRAAQAAAQQRREAAERAFAEAAAAIVAAEQARTSSAAARETAESRRAAARAVLAALEAEAKALLRSVESGAGGDRLLDHVRAAPGFERALAAALGDDLAAAIGAGPRRWTGADAVAGDPPLPVRAQPLADHVTAPPELARRLAQIGVVAEDDGTIQLRPGQRLVTPAGRMRRWDGFITEAGGDGAAERLIRLNRLAEIEQALPPAVETARRAEADCVAADQTGAQARRQAEDARRADVEAAAALRAAGQAEDAATVAIERLLLQRSGITDRLRLAEAEAAAAAAALAAAETQRRALPDLSAGEARVAALRAAGDAAGRALADVRAEAATFARALDADRRRAEAVGGEEAEWQRRARDAARRQGEVARRLADAQAEAAALAGAPERLAGEVVGAEAAAGTAAEQAEAAAAAERAAEAALRQADASLSEAAESLAAAREARAGAAARAENQDLRRVEMGRIAGEKFQCPPPLLPERIGFDAEDVREAAAESAAVDRLVADRERIGPVNLVAAQELAELEAARETGAAEREELGTAIHRLRGSIGSLNREGRARLLAAFEAVDRHFRSLFATLFDGGQAHLELIESDDPLEAGLEIMAQPPGKKLATLTLLSGGEQALTAVALIFALFLTNPAPICVLDEVDAPLDDANIERFCDLLDRMTAETDTRYLIVTHNAVTMSRMHRLYGVTMVERGVSRLVSVDLGGAAELLAAE